VTTIANRQPAAGVGPRHKVSDVGVGPRHEVNQDDQDGHKGATEGDRQTDKQIGNPHGSGVDTNGLPNNPVATAEDAEGANADKTQG
jgi:hypothetical protein